MWKNIRDTNFYLTYAGYYEIFLTDYLNIWWFYLPRSKFLQCLQQSNKNLMMDEDVMLEKALTILSDPNDIKKADINVEKIPFSLTITKMFEYSFKINIEVVKGSRELFFHKITQPLLRTVKDLKDGQSELCEMLIKKDIEINHLKTGNTDTPFHKKTKEFKEQHFLSRHTEYINYFGLESIPSSVLNKIVTLNDMKRESDIAASDTKTNIKIDPDSHLLNKIGTSDLIETIGIKQESEPTIKIEPNTTTQSPRKRGKKINI